jgi:hypothetical protein
MQRIGLMGLAAVGIAALWLVRNFAWVQNPFHPFLGKFFGSAADTIAFTGDVPPLIHRHLVYGESWIEIALLPLRMIGGGADNNPAQFDGVLSPILFFALVPLFLKILWPWIKLSAKVAGVHFLASIILFHALVRYQTPIVCLLILLSVVGIFALRFRKIEGALVIPLLALGMHLVWSGTYLKDRLARDQPWKLLRGQESREEYLTRTVPGFSLIQTVNSSLLDNTKTYLLLTGNHYYYFDRPVEGAYFSQRPLLAWLRQSRDVDDFVAKLQAQGFSHFLLNTKSADTLLHGVLTDDEYRIWQIFLTERAAVIKRDQRYALVAIKG